MAEGRTESVEELRDQLDALWEKHLTLLDNYQQAQQQLGRHLSSGFFSLAQASFKSTSRVRYGRDYYDDRMQAERRFTASVEDDVHTITMQNEPTQPVEKPVQQPTPPSTPPPETNEGKDSEKKEGSSGKVTPSEDKDEKDRDEVKPEKEESTKKPQNPLHWYGILVPPQLRASQKYFISATEGPIIDACNYAQALRKISLEIRKLRKDIKRAEKRAT